MARDAINRLARSVVRVWMRFAHIVGRVNSQILIFLVFCVIFVPAGLLRRVFVDPMRRRYDPACESYRLPSTRPPSDHMKRPY